MLAVQEVTAMPGQASDHDRAALRHREPPCFVVLGADFRIISAELRLSEFLEQIGVTQIDPHRLPHALEEAAREAADRRADGAVAFPHPGVLMRCSVMSGPQGACFAVALERLRTRAPLDTAAEAFRLSARERQVLQLILQGLDAKHIAIALTIAESTVREHFKSLSAKTSTRNRAKLVAKILGWRT